jgi:hypothetical protein
VGSCLMPGAVPIVIQNSTAWAEKGCLPGFYCKFYFRVKGEQY